MRGAIYYEVLAEEERMAMAVEQRAGTTASLAVVAAIGGFLATLTGHPVWGLILDLTAIPLGVMGLLMATSPRVSGGVLSIFALVAAVLGIGLAVLVMVGMLVF